MAGVPEPVPPPHRATDHEDDQRPHDCLDAGVDHGADEEAVVDLLQYGGEACPYAGDDRHQTGRGADEQMDLHALRNTLALRYPPMAGPHCRPYHGVDEQRTIDFSLVEQVAQEGGD